jgi:hypothetical protein
MRAMRTIQRWSEMPRERQAEQVSAATYGTVLVLAALPLIKVADIGSGVGWELVAGVGVATWVAHLYAEVMGDHLRHESAVDRRELGRAMFDGTPILVATVGPAVVLGLGGLDVVGRSAALWIAVVVATLQLVALGVFVGWAVTPRRRHWWTYGAAAAAIGVTVVIVKLSLSH